MNDVTETKTLLIGSSSKVVIADKGYDADWVIELIESQGSVAVIPPRRNRKVMREYDKQWYKCRQVVERTINLLKQFRRIATRYEKTLVSYQGMVLLGCLGIWLR